MKKIFLPLILIIFLIFITGCKEESLGKYELIELQGRELLNYLIENENKNIAVALYFENQDNSASFMDSLEKSLTGTGNNIYYVNMNHLDEYTLENIYDYVASDYLNNSYFAYKNNVVVASNVYRNFTGLLRDLKNLRIPDDEIPKIDEETKLKALERADLEYKDGNISIALDYLNQAWDLKEAKERFEKNELYFLIGSWEAYRTLDIKTNQVKYLDFIITFGFPEIYIYETEGKFEDLSHQPIVNYKRYYYKIENNKICLKQEKTSNKCTPRYNIEFIGDEILEVTDLEDKNIYTFVRRLDE